MHILIVDDSKTIRFMLLRLLKELGYDTISEAADVDAALLIIQKSPPDLIFSDFNMPGKNGVDFLKAIRQNPATDKIPFIMVTTFHDKKIIYDAVKAGLQHYIFKPIEKNLLIEKLTALSISHHIQPPVVAITTHVIDSNKVGDAPPLKDESGPAKKEQSISLEQENDIIEHFFLVFDGEMTIQEFHAWAAANILPHLPKGCKTQSSEQLLDFLRSAVSSGIQSALKKINS
ncbi:MAG: hypothetical protein A2487_20030 [Candidatus Raymondbacteria bacterium RifOxyC12_full_50_8]|uniref:Response regulatory domain-containing protein n=1 Tax=Candidatus Raymondbacteria bacterium RIFOXYD12_FULL_49_13 TaxID=1817890 RepID=A0A1F7F3L8_UNCRA|nr:MAG: hypothetical protein A2248_10025 [Candidatus Raymondbacteria bacterium RIFOXYA2_FULL_49_16]OGJ86188.1 MAG: hypothetical protein A2350_18745 [Candidatus Raymondbacteria bacterium RifOxyB12_full_50_8]OGK01096.1 MAG: hypothetical protein A2519_20275 [Candidatus Raymondbacteria bacterium RIFOXYD12_FULL_49_13]OGK02178.1 MAG: hypothetical protein A2487_20030 [Candidatus Raymondbacteria bacterium RifOxyC12_full_50_8]OGP39306.1 MAG: hypothetical protein A2324_02405 [Candidatus Raymondbacteria b